MPPNPTLSSETSPVTKKSYRRPFKSGKIYGEGLMQTKKTDSKGIQNKQKVRNINRINSKQHLLKQNTIKNPAFRRIQYHNNINFLFTSSHQPAQTHFTKPFGTYIIPFLSIRMLHPAIGQNHIDKQLSKHLPSQHRHFHLLMFNPPSTSTLLISLIS